MAEQARATTTPTSPPGERPLVLVVGSGRSGTSLLAGTLERLGLRIPKPELPPDYTNPRGFAESRWVVDFHSRLLERARVHVSDARPAAWAKTAAVSLDPDVRRELRSWLERELRAEGVVVKDPRLSWFLPLWRRAAADLGVEPRYATMLRHPAAVVDSRRRWYGDWQGDVTRTAAWLNHVLFTERATRGSRRVFLRYDDVLGDWRSAVGRFAAVLELASLRDVSPSAEARVREFVDQTLARADASWDGVALPADLRGHADHVWELVSRLADDVEDDEATVAALDGARARYVELYEDAEAIVQSSIAAASARRPSAPDRMSTGAIRATRRVLPRRVRRMVPLGWRRTVAKRLYSGRG